MKKTLLLAAFPAALALASAALAQAPLPTKEPAKEPAKPAAKGASGGGDPVARVNGVAVPKARLEMMIQQQRQRGAPDGEQLRAQVREELINRELVAQEATRMGLAKSQDAQTQLELARQEILVNAYVREFLAKNPITDADVQKEYDQARAKGGSGKEYKARHILVDTEDQAKTIIAQLRKGAKFEELAKTSKDTGTKDRGGDLDWNVPGVFDKQFADAMMKLDKGKLSDAPVQTRFGFHVIQVDDVRDVRFPPLAEVRQQISQQLFQNRMGEVIKGLRAKAKLE